MIQKPQLTQQEVKDILTYYPETGVWLWNSNKKGLQAGKPAGWREKQGYLKIPIGRKAYSATVLAYLYMEGCFPPAGYLVDHIDTDPTNDRYSNYRLATNSQNLANAKVSSRNLSTGIKGLVEDRYGLFEAKVTSKGVTHTKRFKRGEKEIAIEWLRTTRESLHGEFANHGVQL